MRLKFNSRKEFLIRFSIPLVGIPWGIITALFLDIIYREGFDYLISWKFLVLFFAFILGGIVFGLTWGITLWPRFKKKYEDKD